MTAAWRRATDDDRLDASLLIPPLRGALAADDPRTTATLAAVNGHLVDDGFIYRYRIDERPLGSGEGAFMTARLQRIHPGKASGVISDRGYLDLVGNRRAIVVLRHGSIYVSIGQRHGSMSLDPRSCKVTEHGDLPL